MASRDTKLKIIVDAENRSQAAFRSVERGLDGIKEKHAGLISSMRTIGAASAVALGGVGLLTKGIIGAGASFEQTQIAFETMLGSAETATTVLRDLASFASKTPFELPQLEEASKRLLAYGTTAEELIPTLEMLGNISAGVGMDKLPQLILAFGQVRAATKLTGAELRQFSEAGVPLLGALATQLQKTEAEILDMVSEGQIGFEDMKKALATLTGEGGKFFNLMERQSQSLGGQWSNLKDQISLTARTIGTELMPHLKPLVDRLIEITQWVRNFAQEHPQLTAGILIAVAALLLLGAALLPIAIALPSLIIMFGALGATLAFLATGPGLVVVASLVAIGLTLHQLISQGWLTHQAWQDVWLGMKVIAAEAANAVIGTVESMINFIIEKVNQTIRMINRIISLANRVPGVDISKIGELDALQFQRIDTNTIAAADLSRRRGQNVGVGTLPPLTITGNTFLSEDAAERMGDLILQRLKLSNAL